MVNGEKRQSLFSNPLILFLVGMGVALIAVLLAMMVLQPGAQLKTAAYPSSSPTRSAPVADRCACYCIDNSSDDILCPTKRDDNGICSDTSYEYMDITDQKACEKKNGVSCRGYTVGLAQVVYGTLADCEVTSAAVSPTPTSSSSSD